MLSGQGLAAFLEPRSNDFAQFRSIFCRNSTTKLSKAHYFGGAIGLGAGAGAASVETALSSQAVYQRFKSICEPAARRCVVKSKASGVPFPLKLWALSRS